MVPETRFLDFRRGTFRGNSRQYFPIAVSKMGYRGGGGSGTHSEAENGSCKHRTSVDWVWILVNVGWVARKFKSERVS